MNLNRKYDKYPTEHDYVRVRISKKFHNEIINRRKLKWHSKAEYYYNQNTLKIIYFMNLYGVAATVLFVPVHLPFTMIVNGVKVLPDYLSEIKELFHQKKYGAFHTDYYRNRLNEYTKSDTDRSIYHTIIEHGKRVG